MAPNFSIQRQTRNGISRYRWCGAAPEFLAYHTEWGFPVSDDHLLFERRAWRVFNPDGLSWRTILAKRENFRAASMVSFPPG